MKRLASALVLVAAGLLFTPAVASAQFGLRPNPAFPGPTPVIVPSVNPFFYIPQYRYVGGTNFGFQTMMGNFLFSTRQVYWGLDEPVWGMYPTVPAWQVYYYYSPAYYKNTPYMIGGGLSVSGRPDLLLQQQRAIAQAQRYASTHSARDQITAPASYEKGGVLGLPEPGPQGPPAALRQALAAANPADVASGESLNAILKEIIRVDTKSASVATAYVPPLLLDDVRFGGSPAADLLNFARKAGNLPFPPAFNDPALANLRDELEKDFAAAAAPVLTGKAPEGAKVARLETTFQRLQDTATPVVKNLPFEDATAARRFLNRMAGAIKGMKGNTPVGLIDPKWAAEGLTASDLVRHMNRHKLLFGPAPSGNEESYMTLHRNLVTYLFVLTPPKK